MRKRIRQALVLVLLIIITAIYLNGTRLMNPVGVNSSLSNLSYFGPGNSWNSLLFGDQTKWSSMQRYVSLLNTYDDRKNYGLLDTHDEAAYTHQFSHLASQALSSWQQYQLRGMGQWAYQEIDGYFGLESLRQSRSPVLLVGLLAAVYSGKTLRYRLDSRNQVEAQTSVQSNHVNRQYFGWKNHSYATSMGASYGTDGATLRIQKQIAPGVSVNYDHSRQKTIGVSYSAGF